MEPDVVLEQGDTCEQCYFLYVIPADLAHRLDSGFHVLHSVAAAAIEQLGCTGDEESRLSKRA
jgi:hypothetical protein